ncbi:hypothetical protein A3A54_02215 [Candidatus Curtissbacteria bacterium RIFCSPLOWO2_01_FULL_39_62]|uniref:Uncharacterized protein n=2 Tax=Candidatus Curtissiibacteriota TaxID=1752717 RepID=A0A1F5GC52_9BACT|nr:MAG: hypothetical protein A2775_01730 [Candidatus Curtissbacteria bacterium RIFCSPHIGHO2_01_FULL_39_57]OGD89426.1 MAG: hypothetical protein A3D04_04480 [Candidatus Curtissbacteria bacterium RIFCSPHIGHO2_02_FULL_40_16b]OGE00379.1 MAG: hypothetical protein A3J17_02630 [Candidatus Curtissbacteria bacterium RIFCSPLOWO2_02_FULL_40_11]OGE01842.1 MAG: hypothetical protein A3A54_02215 [Candidatus Curtissbacteria bacterium RIFCSPLOWO2_01_FULL_39_62]
MMNLFKRIWKVYKPIAQSVGNFMGQFIMTVFYLIILLPLGILIRLFSDVLKIKKSSLNRQKSNFEKWVHPKQDVDEARKQY